MDWCGSPMPKIPKYQSINEKNIRKVILASASDCEALILEDIFIYDVPSRQRAVKFVLSNN
jgi:hypothetical protein